MQKHLSRSIMSIGILCWMVFAVSPALACSPSLDSPQPTREDLIESAPMILIGTAVEGITSSYGVGYEVITEADIEVESYLRGEGPTLVHISGFGVGADCRSPARLNERAIFFVSGNPAIGLRLASFGAYGTVWDDSPENIETITAITGENNVAYPLPLTTQFIRFVIQYATWIITLTLLAIVFAFAPMILRRIRHPRKPKVKRS